MFCIFNQEVSAETIDKKEEFATGGTFATSCKIVSICNSKPGKY
jgi:hypothetical protein